MSEVKKLIAANEVRDIVNKFEIKHEKCMQKDCKYKFYMYEPDQDIFVLRGDKCGTELRLSLVALDRLLKAVMEKEKIMEKLVKVMKQEIEKGNVIQ